jgi:hypothetical protein
MVVAQKLEGGPMDLIRAGLGLRAHHARACHAELSVVIGGRNLGFRDGIERRVDDDPAQDRVVIIRAVEEVRCAGKTLAVHQHPVRSLWILGGGGSQAGGKSNHPGGHQLEVGEPAAEDRQVGDHAIAVSGRDVAALRFENPDLRVDFHRLVEIADFQACVEAEFRVDRDIGILLLVRLESRSLDANAVVKYRCTKFPDSFVMVDAVTSRPVSVMVTLAFGTAAPVESVTVPTMLPYTACAYVRGTATSNSAVQNANRANRCFMAPPVRSCNETNPRGHECQEKSAAGASLAAVLATSRFVPMCAKTHSFPWKA